MACRAALFSLSDDVVGFMGPTLLLLVGQCGFRANVMLVSCRYPLTILWACNTSEIRKNVFFVRPNDPNSYTSVFLARGFVTQTWQPGHQKFTKWGLQMCWKSVQRGMSKANSQQNLQGYQRSKKRRPNLVRPRSKHQLEAYYTYISLQTQQYDWKKVIMSMPTTGKKN
jgi:hypothetical protein